MNQEFKQRIDQLLSENRLVLFMKGYKHQPQCGFSARVVGMLGELEVDYHTVDVLSDPEVRSGMKEYSEWPTFPQLYFENEFIGGCDIVTGMFQSGELQKMLGVEIVEVPPPNIELTDSAVQVFQAALQRHNGEIHIEVDSKFQCDVGIGPRGHGDIEVRSNNFMVLMSKATAKRSEGLRIDYDSQTGLIVDNPNAPLAVKQLDVRELKHWMDTNRSFHLFDVRGNDEMAIASIEGAKPLADSQEILEELPKDAIIVFQCHHGMRSLHAANIYLEQGFTNVFNLHGGIHAWSLYVDPNVPTY